TIPTTRTSARSPPRQYFMTGISKGVEDRNVSKSSVPQGRAEGDAACGFALASAKPQAAPHTQTGRLVSLLRPHLLQHLLDRPFQGLAAQVLVTDHALVVEHVNRREAVDLPGIRDAAPARTAVPPGAPGNALLLDDALDLGLVVVTVDAQQRE